MSFIAALPHVKLATASSIMFTAPVLVTLFSVWFLGERIGIWRWSAVIAGFVGAVIIIRPGAESFKQTGAVLMSTRTSCAWSALGHAVASVADYRECPRLDAPATPERILHAIRQVQR